MLLWSDPSSSPTAAKPLVEVSPSPDPTLNSGSVLSRCLVRAAEKRPPRSVVLPRRSASTSLRIDEPCDDSSTSPDRSPVTVKSVSLVSLLWSTSEM